MVVIRLASAIRIRIARSLFSLTYRPPPSGVVPSSVRSEGAASPRSPSRASTGSAECQDRKSTRLNSSHSQISYAVFCLKKKKTTHEIDAVEQRSFQEHARARPERPLRASLDHFLQLLPSQGNSQHLSLFGGTDVCKGGKL